MKLSDYVATFVRDQGVKHVFMVAGGGAMHLNDSFGHCPGLEFISSMHEQAAAMATETYAKVTENLGAALVTTGPGGTNTVTGVAGAWLDSTPCLFISGQVKRTDRIGNSGVRQLGIQEVDIASIVHPITKYAVTVMEPEQIRYHLEKAVYLARSGRPGPVWIDIPIDVQASPVEETTLQGFDPQPVDKNAELNIKVAEIMALLQQAERPVLLIGNGVRLAGGKHELNQLLTRLNIPVLTTWLALDMLPESHPRFVGRPGTIAPRGANFAMQNADLLISIGARLDIAITGYDRMAFARGAKKVMVDVDKYELRKLHPIIDIPIQADARDFLGEFNHQLDATLPLDFSQWMQRCKKWYEAYPVVLPEYRDQTDFVNTYVLSEVVSEVSGEGDMIVPGSSGAGIEIFLLAYKAKPGQRVLQTSALGAMGYGLPAAIGACIASSLKRTIAVDGDGGFQLNIQELEVVKRLNLPIKFFILNNNGYASIRTSQSRYFGRLSGADQTSGFTVPDIRKVASAYGLATCLIANPHKLDEQVREVLDMPGPVLCEVMISPEEPRAPSLSSRVTKSGKMISKPLEDLWPFLSRQEFLSNMIIPPIEEPED
jgi:acetolactate synthase-1/2/3 large subunit